MTRLAAALVTAAACASAPPAPEAGLAAWPADPAALEAHCATLPWPELQVLCRVQAAAAWAATGDAGAAARVCAAQPAGTWADECAFRTGEALAGAGHLVPALSACRGAGWYARSCLTHAAWALPRAGSGGAPAARALSGLVEAHAAARDALAGAPDGLAGEGADIAAAALAWGLIFGSGHADAALADARDPWGPALRTAWALEAARLCPDDDAAGLLARWRGEAPACQGTPLGPREMWGAIALPVPLEAARGLPHLPTPGGGQRLVGETATEDLHIAILEALAARPTPARASLRAALDDPRPRLRMTAARALARGGDPADTALLAARAATDPALRGLGAAPPERRRTPAREPVTNPMQP